MPKLLKSVEMSEAVNMFRDYTFKVTSVSPRSQWVKHVLYQVSLGIDNFADLGVGDGGPWVKDQAPPPVLPLTDHIMKSSNGNFFHIAGHLCGEFTGHWLMFPLIYA